MCFVGENRSKRKSFLDKQLEQQEDDQGEMEVFAGGGDDEDVEESGKNLEL